MDTLLQAVFILSVLAVLPAFATAIYAERKVANRLRTQHASLWAKIAPDPRAESSLSSSFARFITQRRYLELGDAELSRLGDQARKRLYIATFVFMALVLSALGSSFAKQLA